MFYKMEVSYDDYNKVKTDTNLKKDILEEMLRVIEIDCKFIELAKPTQSKEEILAERENAAVKKDRKVISYPNEKDILQGLYNIRIKKFRISRDYGIIRKSLENLLNYGSSLDGSEIIRDFDGWSWNVAVTQIDELYLNLTYQNIRMLVRKCIFKQMARK